VEVVFLFSQREVSVEVDVVVGLPTNSETTADERTDDHYDVARPRSAPTMKAELLITEHAEQYSTWKHDVKMYGSMWS
jgi:hypothetical protein